MTNLISDRYERRCFNDDFRHRNSQYWRYLLLSPRQKGKLSTKTCTWCKSIPTTCKICTWCKSVFAWCKFAPGIFLFIGGRFVSASLSSLVRRVFRSSTPSGAHLTAIAFRCWSLWGDPYTPMTQ